MNRGAREPVDSGVSFNGPSSCCVRSPLLRCLAASLVLMFSATLLRAGQPISDQDGVRRYGLSSGLEVVLVPSDGAVRARADADARLHAWLVVRTGTMDEHDDQRGAAYVAERLARAATNNAERETIDALLSDADAKDAHAGARGSLVMLDQTVFMGRVRAGDRGAMRQLLGYYASVLTPGEWSLDTDAVDAARDEVIARFDAMMGPQLRARQRWLPELLADTGLGQAARLPEGDALRALDHARLVEYIARGYRASRATLIVVGDAGGLDLEAQIADALGGLERKASGGVRDLRGTLADPTRESTRYVTGLDPELDGHQVATVWVRGRDGACLEPWGMCASHFDEAAMRDMVLGRLAIELIRYRLERLLVASLGGDAEIAVDSFELAGQIELLQCVVEIDQGQPEGWARSIEPLLRESQRLALGRVGTEEIARARGALLARWHREADAWNSMHTDERVWLVHWLVTSGRPVLDAPAWDRLATRIMGQISDAEINALLRDRLASDRARVLAVTRGEPDDARAMNDQLRAISDQISQQQIEPIGPGWMRTLGGELLDKARFDAQIEQITQHAPSDTWGATLANGVRVWARHADDDREERVVLSAMLWGAMFADGSLREDEIEAALIAWNTPSSEPRDAGWIAVFCESRGIEVRARRVVGGVRLMLTAPSAEREAALQLLYLLLDRPVIDAGAFADWSGSARRTRGVDHIEHALAMLYNPPMARALTRDDASDAPVVLDDAQRTLTRIIRNANIHIGIAGAIDAPALLEQAAPLLGELATRETSPTHMLDLDPTTLGPQVRELTIQARNTEYISGVLGGSLRDLDTLRATILAAMVLEAQAKREARERGMDLKDLDAQVVLSDALSDRWALMLNTRGDDAQSALALLNETAQHLMREGIDDEELDRIKDDLVRSIGRYFGSSRYWSTRLSTVGIHGRTVEDLWTIRDGYARVDAEAATQALRDSLGRVESGSHRFVIRAQDSPGH